jgi:hypothetical protein
VSWIEKYVPKWLQPSVWAVTAVISGALALWGIYATAKEIVALGVPGWGWAIVGASGFMISLGAMQAKLTRHTHESLDAILASSNPKVLTAPAEQTAQAPSDAPKAPPPPPVASKPTDADEVARFRGMWEHLNGSASAHAMLTLFDAVVDHGPHHWWTDLLKPVRQNLESSATALDEALDIKLSVHQDVIVELFNKFYGAYLRTGEVLYQWHKEEKVLGWNQMAKAYYRWLPLNSGFRRELELLTSYPNWHQRLAIWWRVPTDAARFANSDRYPWDIAQPPSPIDGSGQQD